MPKYRKTALIEASQWHRHGDHPAVEYLPDSPRSILTDSQVENPDAYGWVPTLEGGHVVTPGDWIATGAQGEHWPIKPDIFAATYELVEE
jgi:hypothetical protein